MTRARSLSLDPQRYRFDAQNSVWLPREAPAEFRYTDGDSVELRLLQWLRGTADRSVLSMPLRAGIVDWPSRYHLSPRRANLLRPIESLFRGAAVLEIGAGCGAMTRFMAESGAQVMALEGSPQRAAVTAARCAGLDCVTVVADALDRLPVQASFDVATLIGVLEYARIFFPAPAGVDPVDAMLAHVRRHLRPGGTLVLAIENQLGLKYFAGANEDHVAAPMFGIEDRYRRDGVVTFGRAELARRLNDAGFTRQRWLYPFPDYKLPVSVLSEAGLRSGVDLTPLLAASVVADPQPIPRHLFSLEQAWRTVWRNGLAADLANSFLVLAELEPASDGPPNPDVLAWHFAAERRPVFAKSVSLHTTAAGIVAESRRLDPTATAPLDVALSQRLDDAPFVAGELWQGALLRLLNEPGWTRAELVDWARRWLDCVERRLGHPLAEAGAAGLKGDWIDAVPRNLIIDGDRAEFIDLEWVPHQGIAPAHLLYRGILLSLLAASSIAAPADPADLKALDLFIAIAAALGHPLSADDLAACHEAERAFQWQVNGVEWISFEELLGHKWVLR
ncbi:MAG: class I SAM-dependent methyltransferase [Burkholderiaceae bacterium]